MRNDTLVRFRKKDEVVDPLTEEVTGGTAPRTGRSSPRS